MKFLIVVSILLAAMAGHVLSIPNANSDIGPASEPPNLAVRTPPVETGAASDDDHVAPLSKRDALGDLVQNTIDFVDSGALDFNQIVQEGVTLFGQSVALLDLNSLVTRAFRRIVRVIRSIMVTGIPTSILMMMVVTIGKKLVAKIDFNAVAQTLVSLMGRLLATLDFNTAIRTALGFLQDPL
ncbi:hypothetical protein ACJZ2D_001130 [Fusarium nematophilum]